MSNIAFFSEEDAALINPEDVAGLIAAGVISPEQPGLRMPTGSGVVTLPDTLTPAQLLAQQNAARLGEVAAAANRAGGFVTGADQDEVDAILAGVESGIYSAADALGRLSNIEAGGRSSVVGGGDGSTTAGSTTAGSGFQTRTDARNTIRSVLQTYGLGNLSDYLYDLYAKEEVNIENPDALLFAIRDTTEYKTRFAANSRRASKGLPELDPGSYFGLENQYRDLLRSNGLPLGFYDQTSDFEKFIENDVSPFELQSRLTNGYRQVADADPEVRRQMRELYNVDEAGLVSYFLDPERATPLLERQARAAQIAARSMEQAGIQIGAQSAEELAARGITPSDAQQQFARMGQLAGLYQEMGGEQALTEQEKIGAAFGFDVQAQEELERRRSQRVGEFQAGGQFARTTGATSGTIETGVGTAQ
jgi:hypothetical protein